MYSNWFPSEQRAACMSHLRYPTSLRELARGSVPYENRTMESRSTSGGIREYGDTIRTRALQQGNDVFNAMVSTMACHTVSPHSRYGPACPDVNLAVPVHRSRCGTVSGVYRIDVSIVSPDGPFLVRSCGVHRDVLPYGPNDRRHPLPLPRTHAPVDVPWLEGYLIPTLSSVPGAVARC